jgi:flagellar motor protein MotB
MVVMNEPAAKSEQNGYNRGLILGLTMAESMLLLVFCLLLVAAAIISAEQQKTEDALRKLEIAQAELKIVKDDLSSAHREKSDLQKTVEALLARVAAITGSASQSAEIEKEWRELVDARDALGRYKEQGLNPDQIAELRQMVEVLEKAGLPSKDIAALQHRLDQLLAVEVAREASKPHEWPPIINLSEAGGYFFRSGSAELAPEFSTKLSGSISDQIAESLERYQVDIIEVIGHTDEQPISRTGSNFDQAVIDVVDGRKPVTAIVPADNAGLGMARAIAVTNVLKSDPKLAGASILPMSGAQLVLPGDTLTTGQAGDVESRRRIEIRIRRKDSPARP